MSRKQRKLAAAAARTNPVASPDQEPKPPQPDQAREDLSRTYLEKFQPADGVELDLVEEMISAQWRQRCLAIIEDAAFAQIMSGDTPDIIVAFEVKSKALAAIERSRKGYALQFSRALATLTKLRASLKSIKPVQVPAPTTAQPETYTSDSPAPSHHPPSPSPVEENHNRPRLE
jgi:hypothetical protein